MDNIEESNQLIAEFMGAKFVESNNIIFCYNIRTLMFNSPPSIRELKYHKSWDWLMPVVEKIMNTCYDIDETTDRDLINSFYNIRDTFPEIHKTYKVVVEFIKWYNKK